MAWTEEMVEDLKKMWKKGLTTNEIAKVLGVSKNSIVGKVHRLNLIARPSPIKKKEEVPVKKRQITSSEEKTSQKTSNKQTTLRQNKVQSDLPLVEKTPVIEESVPIEEKRSTSSKFHKNTCIKLADLDSHTCRWPIGDPRDDNFCFCGRHVKTGQTYCEEHAAIAYVKPIKKEK